MKLKTIFMALALLTALNASAIYQLAPEDVEYFVQYYDSYFPGQNNQPTRHLVYSQTMTGDYDGDLGAYIAPINRAALPDFLNNASYGFTFLIYNPLDYYYYYEDYDDILYDGYNKLCEYEQTNGIYQIIEDEPYDPEDEFANPIIGAYFRGGFPTSYDIILIIYEVVH